MVESTSDTAVPSPTPPRRPRTLPVLLAGATVVIVALAIALVVALDREPVSTAVPSPALSATTTSVTVTAKGTVSLPRYEQPRTSYSLANWKASGPVGCEGIGGFDDMVEGSGVTVYSSSGEVVGVGALSHGVRIADSCEFPFEVTGVPDLAFYQVEVSHRGKVAVTRATIGGIGLSLG